jgi:RPA family protein
VEQKRLTAVKVWIGDIHSGTYVKNDDAPAKVVLPDGREVSRANIIGIAVGMDEGVVVDDGTGSILVRSFDKPFSTTIGDCVVVIGLIRDYMGEKYITGEIVKKVTSHWFDVRKKELPRVERVLIDEIKIEAKDENTKVLEIIRALDTGEGVDYEKVVSQLGTKGESMITHLLATGELFETRPGKLKILE